MSKVVLLVVMLLSLLFVLPAYAQTANNPADNWCYDGGPLAGRCTTNDPAETHWLWLYGFFRAQIAKGALSVNDIPAEYRIGLEDSGTSNADEIRDAEGNIIAGRSADFQGTISTCRFTDDNLYIRVIWLGLDIAGDRITINTEEGSVSRNQYVPTSAVDVEYRIGDPADDITPGGTMSVYYRGVLIGRSDLNGLFNCEDDT